MTEPPITVRKLSSFMQVSCCLMTDATGVDHCNHPPPEPVPWRQRMRWRIRDRVDRWRLRLGEWIAGREFREDE